MRITNEVKQNIRDAYFMAGFGHKDAAKITKTVSVELECENGSNVMNPPVSCTFRRNGKSKKRVYCYSLDECINAVRRYK